MSVINWDNSYSVGVEVIDNQHKELIKMLNELLNAMKDGKGSDAITQIVGSLAEYAKVHLNTEEALMSKYNYAEINSHKAEHDALRNKVDQYKRLLPAVTNLQTIELMNFLSNWLNDHIKGTDKKLGKFLNNNVK